MITPTITDLIASFEGCRLIAYQDKGGVWTIGWGHTLGVKQRDTCTIQQAGLWLIADSASAARQVLRTTGLSAGARYVAMTSLCFNIGDGAFRTSSVLRFHRARSYQAAADAFLLFDKEHIDGQLVMVKGLLNRRQKERALYLTEGL